MERIDQKIRRYYENHPRSISSPFGGNGVLKEIDYLDETLRRLRIDLLGKTLLEIGCGGGWFGSYCKPKVKMYVGIDISLHCVHSARQISGNILQANAESIPMKANAFDYVFCIDSFEHIPRQQVAAKEIYQVLKEGGKVFLSIPNYSNVCGLIKKIEEFLGFYEKDTWSPFDHWAPQAFEQFMTPARVKRIFVPIGFRKFQVIGGHRDLLDGVFPWINHKWMPRPSILRRLFQYVENRLNELLPWVSLHNFWLIEK